MAITLEAMATVLPVMTTTQATTQPKAMKLATLLLMAVMATPVTALAMVPATSPVVTTETVAIVRIPKRKKKTTLTAPITKPTTTSPGTMATDLMKKQRKTNLVPTTFDRTV
ncbi:hypothetical protein D3C73_1142630 [compost metagenome]